MATPPWMHPDLFQYKKWTDEEVEDDNRYFQVVLQIHTLLLSQLCTFPLFYYYLSPKQTNK